MFRVDAPVVSLLAASGILTAALAGSLRAREPLPGPEPGLAVVQGAGSRAQFTGPGACAAAACHGAVRPAPGGGILQTEYTTWIAQDRHARATEVLGNAVSGRMARILGLPDARTAPTCLACHSVDAPEGSQARTFASEGVSCEACHGPASAWLGPHTTRGWTHAQSLQLGMYDTKDPAKRTERCLTCHLGTPEKFVDHAMIAAGHPDLVFDLEAFSAAMPRHWRPATEADPYATVTAFSVGQLVHLRAWLDRLTRRMKESWPEYAEMDCFACHHSITRPEESWRQAQGYGSRRPGDPPLNVSRWATARHVLAVHDAEEAAALDEALTALALEASRRRPDQARVSALAARADGILGRGVARAAATRADGALARRLFAAIAGDVDRIAAHGERAAEGAAMALETLYAASAGASMPPAARAAFDDLFSQFRSPSSYEPRRFVAGVRRIEGAIGASP